MKKFGSIFLGALLGGGAYELYLYLLGNFSSDWKSIIIQVVSIALAVSIVLLLIRDYLKRKSVTKTDEKGQ